MPSYKFSRNVEGIREQQVSSFNEFKLILESLKGRKYLIIGSPTLQIIKAVKKLKLSYTLINLVSWGGIGDPRKKKSISLKEFILSPLKKIKVFLESRYFGYLTALYPEKIKFVAKIDSNAKEKIQIVTHSFDYDRFLMNSELLKPSYIPDEKYILWLPSHWWPIHDNLINRPIIKSTITRDKYQQAINQFLTSLESISGHKIIIAGYPKAEKEDDVYLNRKFLIETETEQLIKYSDVVMSHVTGAFNFAVLHNKPIRLINFPFMNSNPRLYNLIRKYESELNTTIYDIDTYDDCMQLVNDNIYTYDSAAYTKYKQKYIISDECLSIKQDYFWCRYSEIVATNP